MTATEIAADLNDLVFVGNHKVEIVFLLEAWAKLNLCRSIQS